MDELRGSLTPRPLQPANRRGSALRGASALLCVAALALLLTSCAGQTGPAWADSFESSDALARAVIAAYNAGDTAVLMRYALTEHELRTTVWPHLPASRPAVGMSWDYFWRDHAQRTRGYLLTLFAKHARQAYELTGLTFDGRAAYGPVTIHRAPAVDVMTAAGARRLRLFGSMAEKDGRWKLYSYVAD